METKLEGRKSEINRIWPTLTVSGAILGVYLSGFVSLRVFIFCFFVFLLSLLNHSRGGIKEFVCVSQCQNYTNGCMFSLYQHTSIAEIYF